MIKRLRRKLSAVVEGSVPVLVSRVDCKWILEQGRFYQAPLPIAISTNEEKLKDMIATEYPEYTKEGRLWTHDPSRMYLRIQRQLSPVIFIG